MILLRTLSKNQIVCLNGFKNNLLRSNAKKCHLLVRTNGRVSMHVDRFDIDKSNTEKLLGLKFDRKLTFEDHIFDIWKKACKNAILTLLFPDIRFSSIPANIESPTIWAVPCFRCLIELDPAFL